MIITDKNKRSIAKAFFQYARKKSGDLAKFIEIPVGKRNGEEPPSEVIVQMLLFDVELLITTFSLSHTTSRRNASKNGIRIASMPGMTEDTANRCLSIDYLALEKRCRALHEILSGADKIRIKTSLGTDLTIERGDNSVHGAKGGTLSKYGAFGNLPEGDVCLAPENTEGICFIDASMAGIGKLEEPLKIVIEKNRAVSIEGPQSQALRSLLDQVGPKAYEIAELGIGTNDKAIITGYTLEDEKSLGSA